MTAIGVAEPLLLTASEVAKLLRVGRTKVYKMMNSGELPVIRLGKAIRVPKQALTAWLAERTGKGFGDSE